MRSYLKALWLTETVRLVEKESGRFADEDANRKAKMGNSSISHRIMLRAKLLAKKNKLNLAQNTLISAFKFSLIILLFFSVLIGCTLSISVLSQNPVNLYWALFSLLGIHFITLSIWFISFLFSPSSGGSLIIHSWIWLAKKLSKNQTTQQIFPAFISLFNGRIRWLIGFIVNLCWTVILFSALFVLLILFSTKHYSFEWKTTLLSPDLIIAITHYLGQLPSLLGFAMPSDDVIRMSEQAMTASDIRSVWAIWLLGVFVVYGVTVRFLLMLLCGVKWLTRCQSMTLDLNHPEYQLLANDLQPLTTQIIDHDTVGQSLPWQAHFQTENNSKSDLTNDKNIFLVAMDMEESWLPPDFVTFLGFLNTREQRKQILDYLQLSPAKKLLIAIDTDRTPDRGMTNLINQLLEKAEHGRIWLTNSGKQITNWNETPFLSATPTWLIKDE